VNVADQEMSLVEHIEELRKRIFISIAAILMVAIVAVLL
jgi:Sec-independent protein secretion pathway component TatC